jgi:hypothetical protein
MRRPFYLLKGKRYGAKGTRKRSQNSGARRIQDGEIIAYFGLRMLKCEVRN